MTDEELLQHIAGKLPNSGLVGDLHRHPDRLLLAQEFRKALAPSAATQEMCSYCGESYPKPISYHHSTEECHENEARNALAQSAELATCPWATYDSALCRFGLDAEIEGKWKPNLALKA